MATLRAFETFANGVTTADPLSISEEQALILRAVGKTRPEDGPVTLEPGFRLAEWEHRVLVRESRGRRDVRGEALTLLRARAAELAVRRRLAAKTGIGNAVNAAAALLDRTLADIGSATEFPSCENPEGLEDIARVLHGLYDRITEESLRLHGLGSKANAERLWRLLEVRDDEFTVQPLSARVSATPAMPSVDDGGPDAFEIEPADPVSREAIRKEPEKDSIAAALGIATDVAEVGFDIVTAITPSVAAAPLPRPVETRPVAPREIVTRAHEPAPARVSAKPAPPPAKSRMGLVIGVVVALAAGIAAFAMM